MGRRLVTEGLRGGVDGAMSRRNRAGGPEYPVEVDVDAVRAAYESLGEGDVEPLVALIHPEMEWRGRRRLPRPWAPPS
jgi:hypothetical protein